MVMRNPGLDMGRVSAAGIVFFGHLIFLIPIISESSLVMRALTPIHTGATAVLFFFSLSGYVLAQQLGGQIPKFGWPISRYVRLLPVYYSAFIPPLILGVLFSNNRIDWKGTIVGLLALQSQFSEYALKVNAPLWSISAELLLSLFIFLVYRSRTRLIWYLVGAVIVILSGTKLGQNPVIYGVPYILLGVWLNGKKFSIENRITGKHNLVLALISYIAISPLLLVSVNLPLTTIVNLLFFTWLIVLLRTAHMPTRLIHFSNLAGMRSYAFYAIHFPIVNLFLRLIDPESIGTLIIYLVLTISVTVVFTELIFRWIDLPAITKSRKVKALF